MVDYRLGKMWGPAPRNVLEVIFLKVALCDDGKKHFARARSDHPEDSRNGQH